MTAPSGAGERGRSATAASGRGAAAALDEARALHQAGRLADAEAACRAVSEAALRSGEPAIAVKALTTLTEILPDSVPDCARLATLLDRLGQTESAIGCYRRLLSVRPEAAAAHFNLALLYKKEKRYREALAAYGQAVRLGIDRLEDVHSNIGVLHAEMRRPALAKASYERALEIDPDYVPALFNLAGLLEETGERTGAEALYRRILAIEPGHAEALSRLAYLGRIDSADAGLIVSLRHALAADAAPTLAREGLYFALGKALDDAGDYDAAFEAYRAGNDLGRRRNPPYDRRALEEAIDGLTGLVDRDWIRRRETEVTESPILICGMLRSGSTLVEQILSAHPEVTAAGELDFLPWLIGRRLTPYPQSLATVSREALGEFGRDYLARVADLFPDAHHVTDKRPDNFLHLGLVRAVFPRVRVVHTRRGLRDNCLSVYFQQLGGNLNYATDLGDTAHYYRLQERLVAHWRECFPESIYTVDYDELVRSPEPVLRGLLEFLGLAWDPRCLEFHRAGGPVQTASLWQVRESLHTRSSGRWQNYRRFVEELPEN